MFTSVVSGLRQVRRCVQVDWVVCAMTDGAAPKFSPKKRQKVSHGLTLQVHRYADAAMYVNGSFDPLESCYLLALTDSGRPSPLFQLGSKYIPEFVKGHKLEGFSKTLDELAF